MSRVLVAGATGYLGRFVAQEFKRQGHWVRALARNPQKLAQKVKTLEPAIHDLVDEVFVGEVTKPESLAGVCDDVDVIFSSIGITRQKDRMTFMDVDYQGNRNLLDKALVAGVKDVVFIHLFNAHLMANIEMVKARGKFVDDLKATPLESTIICPTGYFSDMAEFFRMAQKGTVCLMGNGDAKINPIHGADLAKVCVEAVDQNEKEISVGGPSTFTHRQIAELAFDVLGKPSKIRRIPTWLVRSGLRCLRPFNKRLYTLGRFMLTVSENDFVAPPVGDHTLRDFFGELAKQ